jgi:endo-1,4-beta-xylanase
MHARKALLLALAAGAARGAWSAVVAVLALSGCKASGTGRSPPDASADASIDAVGDGSEGDASGSIDAGDAGADGASCGVPASFKWSSTGPILGPVSDARHNLVAIKDPSVVYYNGSWHVFVSTVDMAGNYNIAYLNFPDWDHTSSATFSYMDQNPRLIGYHAAPQIFYFRPQNKWYLIFQSGPPQYSTNDDLTNVAGWTQPADFFSAEPMVVTQNKGTTGGWLDFWVICDPVNCYLFFSDDNGTFYRSQTSIGSFPSGFGNTVVVMQDSTASHLFEASNVYLMKGTGKYLALVEAYGADSYYHRYFRSWTADSLDGTWTALQDTYTAPFASVSNVSVTGTRWTDDISHGEMLRDGYDETLTIDTCHLQYLYQGFDPAAPTNPYNGIPWKLGLLTQTN